MAMLQSKPAVSPETRIFDGLGGFKTSVHEGAAPPLLEELELVEEVLVLEDPPPSSMIAIDRFFVATRPRASVAVATKA